LNAVLDLQTSAERHAYNPEKHYLGPLCKREHDAGDGHSWRHNGHGNCVECTRRGAREWKKANPDRVFAATERRDKSRENRRTRQTHPIAAVVGNTRGRAKANGIPYNLDTDFAKMLWREQDGRCFWTGRELDFFIGEARHPMRPSFDRIVPSLGYVKGNIVWSSNFANRARGDLSAEGFAELMVSFGFPDVRLAQAARKWELQLEGRTS
jgi:hypothetical protein